LVEKGYKYVEGKGKDCIRAHMKKYWFEVVRKEGLQLIPYNPKIRAVSSASTSGWASRVHSGLAAFLKNSEVLQMNFLGM
jgi:hypothetical protein